MHATEMLRDIPLFKGLSEETLTELEGRTNIKRLEEGEVYLNAGQPPKAFCVVLSGQLKFYRVNRAGKEQVFGYARPHDVFGLTSLTDPYKSVPMNCLSRSTTEIAEIDLPLIRELMHREPQFAVAILKEQSKRYSDMLDLVDQLSLKDAHNRLAKWLDAWVDENHPEAGDNEVLVVLPYTQSEIAAQIGTVREVVSRGFSRMEKDGILRASGKRVTILSRKRLRQMAES
ncbi:MAG: Crp/Fnr family transcriptional regulator [Planctomycetes bacterium]|nr:Crp/Fnr family transcriptional regulator [Planctomycetota bacterium]MCA8946196.1 Crp/Fnr family transcriptional regulator [Planctomycetota bacterium]